MSSLCTNQFDYGLRVENYLSQRFGNRWVQPEYLVYGSVEIRQLRNKLVPGGIGATESAKVFA
jgi:hypothetical protein